MQKCETPPRKPSELQTESAVKERCFQRQNALKRKAEAMVDGLLLTDEITEEVQQEAARAAKVQKQADQQRAKKKKEYLLNAHLTSTKQSTQWALQNLIGPAWCCPKLGKQLQQEVKEKLHEHNVTSLTQDIIDAIDNNYHNFSMNFIRTTACRTYVKQSFWRSMALRMLKEKFVSCRRSTALPCCQLLRCWVKGARNLSSIRQDLQVALFVTDAFKREEPGMTVLLREACQRGWLPVLSPALKGRGLKPSLLLQGAGEVTQGFAKTKVKCFGSADFLRWLTTICLKKESTARVMKSAPA